MRERAPQKQCIWISFAPKPPPPPISTPVPTILLYCSKYEMNQLSRSFKQLLGWIESAWSWHIVFTGLSFWQTENWKTAAQIETVNYITCWISFPITQKVKLAILSRGIPYNGYILHSFSSPSKQYEQHFVDTFVNDGIYFPRIWDLWLRVTGLVGC